MSVLSSQMLADRNRRSLSQGLRYATNNPALGRAQSLLAGGQAAPSSQVMPNALADSRFQAGGQFMRAMTQPQAPAVDPMQLLKTRVASLQTGNYAPGMIAPGLAGYQSHRIDVNQGQNAQIALDGSRHFGAEIQARREQQAQRGLLRRLISAGVDPNSVDTSGGDALGALRMAAMGTRANQQQQANANRLAYYGLPSKAGKATKAPGVSGETGGSLLASALKYKPSLSDAMQGKDSWADSTLMQGLQLGNDASAGDVQQAIMGRMNAGGQFDPREQADLIRFLSENQARNPQYAANVPFLQDVLSGTSLDQARKRQLSRQMEGFQQAKQQGWGQMLDAASQTGY